MVITLNPFVYSNEPQKPFHSVTAVFAGQSCGLFGPFRVLPNKMVEFGGKTTEDDRYPRERRIINDHFGRGFKGYWCFANGSITFRKDDLNSGHPEKVDVIHNEKPRR